MTWMDEIDEEPEDSLNVFVAIKGDVVWQNHTKQKFSV